MTETSTRNKGTQIFVESNNFGCQADTKPMVEVKEVERIVEVPVERIREVEKIVEKPIIETKYVEKIVEKPVVIQ